MKFTAGSKVKIVGLKSHEGQLLNDKEGVVDHFSKPRQRYAITLPGISDLKMVKEENLNLAEPEKIFEGEDEMMEHLKRMGMPPEMLKNLTSSQKKTMFEMTQRQNIIERAKKAAGIDDSSNEKFVTVGDDLYSWRDGTDHVYIQVSNCDDAITCKIEHDAIHIAKNEKDVMNGKLFQTVIVDESTWEVKDGTLSVVLKKATNMRWLLVTR